jgi:uncharacterized protein (TIGR00369 family)
MSHDEIRQRIAALHSQTPFARLLGIAVTGAGPGWCETRLEVRPELLQQTGVVHAGVQATLADHSAGLAASTVLDPDSTVVSVEFKVNLLRPAADERLTCRAEVVKSGRRIIVCQADVLAGAGSRGRLVSRLSVTLMPVAEE